MQVLSGEQGAGASRSFAEAPRVLTFSSAALRIEVGPDNVAIDASIMVILVVLDLRPLKTSKSANFRKGARIVVQKTG